MYHFQYHFSSEKLFLQLLLSSEIGLLLCNLWLH